MRYESQQMIPDGEALTQVTLLYTGPEYIISKPQYKNLRLTRADKVVFLTPTGALEDAILSLRASVRDFMLRMALKGFLKHSKGSRGVIGQASTWKAFSRSHAL